MPSIEVRLAWSVEVSPDQLGAHLQAYFKALPAITAFRLCSRFGRGEKCTVNKLPTELVDQIIHYMHKRKKPLITWTRLFRCHEARCKPIDHYTREDIMQVCAAETGEEATKWHPEMTSAVLSHFDFVDSIGESDPEEDNMQARHIEMREKWFKLTGVPGLPGRGFFTKHKDIILKQFGLEIMMAHFEPADPKPDQGHRLEQGEAARTTSAYLVLPTSGVARKESNVRYDEMADARLSTEDHLVARIEALPAEPSEDATRRFAPAVKLLGLTPITTRDVQHLSASDADVAPPNMLDADARICSPILRLLVTNKDDSSDEVRG